MQDSVHQINDLMAEVRRLLESAQFDAALRLSQRCLELSDEMTAPALRAGAIVTRGITLARTNEHLNALSLYDSAIELYESLGDELMAAKVRMNRVHSYSHLSRYEDAVRDGEASNRTFARLGEKQLLARGLNNLGEVFFRLDRFQDWLDTVEHAAALLREIGDDKSLALVYMNHAVVLTSLNRADEARVYYQLSKEKAEESGQTWLAACGNYNLGYLHYMQGEYTRALDLLTETRTALAADPWYRPLCDLTQSEIYLEMNMYPEAMAAAQTAYKGFEDNHKPFEMAKALAVMAIAQSKQDHFQEAARLFDQARTMFRAQGNEVRAAGMDLYQGAMWLHQGRHEDARMLALNAYEAFAKENVKHNAAFARIVSARAALEAGDLNTASADIRIAEALQHESPRALLGHQLHALCGEIQRTRGDLAAAASEFRLAIQELEAVRANIAADELRLNYFKDKVPVYERLMLTNLQSGDPANLREAFETAERAKSRTLVDLLAGSVDSLKQARASSLEEIQQALAADTVLVEYAMTGESVAAFCVSRAGFEVFQNICSAGELKKRFGFIQFHFSRLAANPESAKARPAMALANIQEHLRRMHEMLVAPVERFLTNAASIVFVPSGFLHYVPFHALFDGRAYLTDRFVVSYAPTATIYRLMGTSPRLRPHFPQALLIGAPDDAAPMISNEIENIASVLPGARTFIGPAATTECLKREIQTSEIVHIASHATFRPDNPMFSSFQLHDGAVNFYDIYNLQTAASLITLSGCGTGLSSIVAGDELLGLVRGFLYAGATSVVLSLWDVNDRTTAELMKAFYSQLTGNNTIAGSLRSAMIRIREQHPHPYYWAPFLLVGNPSASF